MTLPAACSHEESRITCIDCSSPICSNCLIQCPVGFRCKSCGAGTAKNSRTSTTGIVTAQTLALCAAIGFAAGWIMLFINVPFLACFICYFLGIFVGRWLGRIIDIRLRDTAGKIVAFGLLIGLSFSPYNVIPMLMVETILSTFLGQGGSLFGALSCIASALFCPVGFIVGVMRAAVWGEYW